MKNMNRLKDIKNALLGVSRNIILAIAGFTIVASLMFYQLVSLTPGLSAREVEVYNSAKTVSDITNNMVNTPYKAAIYTSTKIFHPEFGLRLVGALIGTISVILFFLLVSHLYGKWISIATTAMFASSSLLLGMTRTATPVVISLSLLTIIAVGAYIRFSKRPELGWILGSFVVGLSIYVPGLLLFIIPAAIWQLKYIRPILEKIDKHILIIGSAIFSILLIPFLLSVVVNPSLIMQYLGFDQEIQPFATMLKYSYVATVSLFLQSPLDSAYWLGRQPVLDIFLTIMFILGVYNLVTKYTLNRLWIVLGITITSIAWIGVTTNRYSIIILLPFVYIVIGSGVSMIIERWFAVFPRNPFARYIGVGLIAIAIAVSINFQLRRYFVAWANHQPTKDTFSERITE